MRLLELPAVLRAAGLIVHEWSGWRTHGSDSWGPVRGIICHGTGGRLTSTDAGEINVIAVTGSATAPEVPIAQLYQSRSGEWTVIASGKATGVKTGTAGPLKGYSDGSVLQIEAQHNGSEPWTEVQYRSYVRGVAALVRYLKIPVSMVVGHYEHQPTEKTDPWFDMNRFRADVTEVLIGDDVDENTRADIWAITNRQHALLTGEDFAWFNIGNEPKIHEHPTQKNPDGSPVKYSRKEPNKVKEQLTRIENAVKAPVIDYSQLAAALIAAGVVTEAGVRSAVRDGFAGGAAAFPADVPTGV